MTVKTTPHPPLLLRRHAGLRSGLEVLLAATAAEGGDPAADAAGQLAVIARQVKAGEDYNRYIFAQYVMYLYIRIFLVETGTSQVYCGVLRNIPGAIRTAWQDRRVTDRALGELIRVYIPDGASDPRGGDFVDALKVVRSRLDPDAAYPGINTLLTIVCAIYDDRPDSTGPVVPYRVVLSPLDGVAAPTLSLTSTTRRVTLDTTACVEFPLLWKFIASLNIPANIKGPGDFSFYAYWLASLALPLDPLALTTVLRDNLGNNNKAGVPFLNYLAMYLRQRTLGFDYTLSRLADPRRIVLQQLHKFCGVGATFIRDGQHASAFVKAIYGAAGQADLTKVFSEEELEILGHLHDAIDGQNLRFVRELRYGYGVEAAKVAIKVDDTTDTDPDAKPVSDDGAFAADPEPEGEDLRENEPDASQTGNDNIDETGVSNQAPAARPPSTLLPLALPTETIDDHLYRLTVLRLVSDLSCAQDPDIDAETLSLLKVWCASVLFIASSAATRTLISQLKATGKLKEFIA